MVGRAADEHCAPRTVGQLDVADVLVQHDIDQPRNRSSQRDGDERQPDDAHRPGTDRNDLPPGARRGEDARPRRPERNGPDRQHVEGEDRFAKQRRAEQRARQEPGRAGASGPGAGNGPGEQDERPHDKHGPSQLGIEQIALEIRQRREHDAEERRAERDRPPPGAPAE